MSVRQQIERYFGERPWLDHLGRSNFGEEMAVADLAVRGEIDAGMPAADCIADVPVDVKEALAPLALDPTFDKRFFLPQRTELAARAPLVLVNFDRAPFGGAWKPLPDHGGEPAISVRSFFHHSIVGSGAGAWGYFANKTNLESTFIVLKSGYFWQCMSLGEQADAQYHANDWGASAETEDDGDPNTDPWTAEQIGTIVWLTWEVERLCPGMALRILTTWDGSGFGYHSQFGAPSNLTPAVGKTCPGTIRKRQWSQTVAPTILRGGKLVLDADDKKYIGEQVDAMQKALQIYMEDQVARRLGAYLAGGVRGQKFDAKRPGYDWMDFDGTYTLKDVGTMIAGIVKSGLKLDVAALGDIIKPIVATSIEKAIEEHPISMQLADEDRQAIISGAGDAAANRIAERLAS